MELSFARHSAVALRTFVARELPNHCVSNSNRWSTSCGYAENLHWRSGFVLVPKSHHLVLPPSVQCVPHECCPIANHMGVWIRVSGRVISGSWRIKWMACGNYWVECVNILSITEYLLSSLPPLVPWDIQQCLCAVQARRWPRTIPWSPEGARSSSSSSGARQPPQRWTNCSGSDTMKSKRQSGRATLPWSSRPDTTSPSPRYVTDMTGRFSTFILLFCYYKSAHLDPLCSLHSPPIIIPIHSSTAPAPCVGIGWLTGWLDG